MTSLPEIAWPILRRVNVPRPPSASISSPPILAAPVGLPGPAVGDGPDQPMVQARTTGPNGPRFRVITFPERAMSQELSGQATECPDVRSLGAPLPRVFRKRPWHDLGLPIQ